MFRPLRINVLSFPIQINSLLSLSDFDLGLSLDTDVIQDGYGKWGTVGLPITGKVPSYLCLGCLCLSHLGFSVSLDTLMYMGGIYISPWL